MSILTSRSTLSIPPQPYTSVRSWRAPRQNHCAGLGASVIVCFDQSGVTAKYREDSTKLTALWPTRYWQYSRNFDSRVE